MFGIAEYKFDKLADAAKKLTDSYTQTRMKMDQQRTLGFLRPSTQNPERLNSIRCIQNIVIHIHENKFTYQHTAPGFSYRSGLYDREIVPFLKQAILGAFLFELMKITKIYSDETVRGNSALGKVILNLFQIEKLSQFPKEELTACLVALQQFIKNMDKTEPTRQWHNTMSNQQLSENIDACVKSIVQYPPSASSWWESLGFPKLRA